MYYLNTASGAGCYCAVDFCRQSLPIDSAITATASSRRISRSLYTVLPYPTTNKVEICVLGVEYHWTVADHVQAAIDGGYRIVEVVEYGEQIEDEQWLEKMPAHLLIVGRKKGSV